MLRFIPIVLLGACSTTVESSLLGDTEFMTESIFSSLSLEQDLDFDGTTDFSLHTMRVVVADQENLCDLAAQTGGDLTAVPDIKLAWAQIVSSREPWDMVEHRTTGDVFELLLGNGSVVSGGVMVKEAGEVTVWAEDLSQIGNAIVNDGVLDIHSLTATNGIPTNLGGRLEITLRADFVDVENYTGDANDDGIADHAPIRSPLDIRFNGSKRCEALSL